METKIHREKEKKWTLPKFLQFGTPFKPNMRAYDILGFRKPKQGEYFLSGAICTAYEAPNDLGTEYLVIKSTHKVIQRTNWVIEDES
jgi:hypothetical protein